MSLSTKFEMAFTINGHVMMFHQIRSVHKMKHCPLFFSSITELKIIKSSFNALLKNHKDVVSKIMDGSTIAAEDCDSLVIK